MKMASYKTLGVRLQSDIQQKTSAFISCLEFDGFKLISRAEDVNTPEGDQWPTQEFLAITPVYLLGAL